ncbi:hypothetical protein BX666DRAFT_1914034 [Dichotomocladium elegans]|nr:hypothetical protein BX666DRAFT_1914034 [Dichotomocladium elegans]
MVHLEARRGRGGRGGGFDTDSSAMDEDIGFVILPPYEAEFVFIGLCSIVFLGSIFIAFRHGFRTSIYIFLASALGITSGVLEYLFGYYFSVTRTTQLIVMLFAGFTWISLYDIICEQKAKAYLYSRRHWWMLVTIIACMFMDAFPLIDLYGHYIYIIGIRFTLWWIPTFIAICYVCQKYIIHRRSLIAVVVCMGAMPFGRTILLGMLYTYSPEMAFQALWAVFDHMLPTIGLLFALIHLNNLKKPRTYDQEMGHVPPPVMNESQECK